MKIIKKFRLGKLLNNCFLLNIEGNIILIDAPKNIEKVIEYLKENDLMLSEIWLTHAHYDHILGLTSLKKEFPKVLIYGSPKEEEYYMDPTLNLSNKDVNTYVYTGEVISNKKLLDKYQELTIRYVQGHSLEGSIYIFEKENVMFAGDILFRDGIGRSDLINGNYDLLVKGIKDELYAYEEDFDVYTGHGFKTTLNYERKNNNHTKNEN